ncbi:FG-GAP repeat domain-containing protein [Roseicella aerolata]|uniref:VCBS repeat-containing protein n=1 Tax=Roseicella aerolata TaxID=2883479 RepID=A0A9X1IAS2_9PROT|nr:VCBS repeat-containing protein [Roseicella aerolata]MCB4821097.1 VCBS repeat-containing protein [Roseicella aerolata]
MATVTGRWLVGTRYREIIGADDPPGAEPKGDFIVAGPGNDYLIADIGADVFGFEPGHGLDFINHFTPGEDKIQFGGGLTAESLTIRPETIAGVAGLAIYYAGVGGPDSVFLAGVSALQPGDIVFEPLPGKFFDPPVQDFNIDFKSDVVLRRADGSVAEWQMNGTRIGAEKILANPGNDWKVIGSGDFNGNWKPDLLFQHKDGPPVIWNMDGFTIQKSLELPNPGPQWSAVGIGHFDDDPGADILFQHDDGTIVIWFMGSWQLPDGAIREAKVIAEPGPDWKVVGTGDFNGDYKADILFRHEDGRVVAWQMDGSRIAAHAEIGTLAEGASVVGTGDFDNNNRDEILVQQADGSLAMWSMNGVTVTGVTDIANPGPGRKVVDTGDYDGNGKTDILLQHTDGSVEVWLMDGARVASSGIAAAKSDWIVT